jgi:hypothetical protein
MTRARKLAAAHALLVDLLARGPVMISVCVDRAAEIGISRGTVYAALRRLPSALVRRPADRGQVYLELKGEPGPAPEWWRTPSGRKCALIAARRLGAGITRPSSAHHVAGGGRQQGRGRNIRRLKHLRQVRQIRSHRSCKACASRLGQSPLRSLAHLVRLPLRPCFSISLWT